eukprot:TRINITY_DN5305_c0_g1_i4.p1 TRINITY_DN5305_c0_g1~~TRINITY_DN5305_c0_g1_i4.p1  ORF type:complete len:529 (+),score=113.71 TRINITY_DN5305_c0_g1_i4:169-1755(+)
MPPGHVIIRIFALLGLVSWSGTHAQCAAEDFSIQYGTNIPFSVSQANFTCSCPAGLYGKHFGDGSGLTNLSTQAEFNTLAAQHAALQSQMTALLDTLAINECATNNGGCGSMYCKDLFGPPPLCYCPAGYVQSPPLQCSDFNECANNATICGVVGYTSCTNLPGSWSCACINGGAMLNGFCVPTIPAPGSLAGVNYNTRVGLSWTAPSTSLTLVDYAITVSPPPAAGSATRYVGSAGLAYVFYNLTNGVSYTFTIKAFATELSVGLTSAASGAVVPNARLTTSGLVYHLDAGNSASYPGSGNNWVDLTGSGTTATFANGKFTGTANSPSAYIESTGAKVSFMVTVPHAAWMTNTFTGGTKRWMIEEIVMTYTTNYPEANGGSVASDTAAVAGAVGFDWQHGVALGVSTFRMGVGCAETQNPNSGYDDDFSIPISVATVATASVWQHRVLFWDRLNNAVGLYVNGVRYGPMYTGYVNGYSIYDGGGIVFGSLYGWQHNGRRSIIRIYNRMLSDDEIQDNFVLTKARFGL